MLGEMLSVDGERVLYLDKGDAVGWHSDVIAELVEELRKYTQGSAAELKLIRPETQTHV